VARVEQLSDPELMRIGGYVAETNTTGSIALTLVLLEAQSLRSHAFNLFIKRVNFLIEPRVLRFRRIAAAQLFERLLNGEFGGFGHGHPGSLIKLKARLRKTPMPAIGVWGKS
jgi:hypothetical protein